MRTTASRTVLWCAMTLTAVRAALLYGADSDNNVVRIDTNARTVTTVANTSWSGMGFDGFISALDPPPAGPLKGGRYYLSPFTGANGNSANCVQMVLPPPPSSFAAGAEEMAAAAGDPQMLCLGAGVKNAIWSLAVDPNTHTLYLLTTSAVVSVTPEQFARGASTVLLSPPPPGLMNPNVQLQLWVGSVWDPVHRVLWYAQGGNGEYPINGFNYTLIGVKPNPHGTGAALVGPLTGALPAAAIQMYWNHKAQEFAGILSDGHYGPVDCGVVRFSIDINALSLTVLAPVWQQYGSYEDCANTGAWTNADGPTEHGTVWALWNDDWYQWALYGFDMSQPPQQQPTAQWSFGEQYNFPFVALQPLA